MKNLKKLLSLILALMLVFSTASFSVLAEETGATSEEGFIVTDSSYEEADDFVAYVDGTGYDTIDEAVANWTDGTTLTLNDNVTLSDVILLKSTETYYLELGEYTLTAASGKDAIQILNEGIGNAGAAKPCLYIDADDDNVGGISAEGYACVYYDFYTGSNGSGTEHDRPIIYVNGGTFRGKYGLYTKGTGMNTSKDGKKTPQFVINDGIFDCTSYDITGSDQRKFINTMKYTDGYGRVKLVINGGVFHGKIHVDAHQTANVVINGGRFSYVYTDSNLEPDAAGEQYKWVYASGQAGVYTEQEFDRDVYIDSEGYITVTDNVLTTEEKNDIFLVSTNAIASCNKTLPYSNATNDGAIYFESLDVALSKSSSLKFHQDYSGDVAVTSKDVTLDFTDVIFDGTITMNNYRTVTVKYAADGGYDGTVLPADDANYKVDEISSTTSDDGIVTKKFKCSEYVDETNATLRVEHDGNVEYFKSFSTALATCNGTDDRTVVFMADQTGSTFNSNSMTTYVTIDLNGYKWVSFSGGSKASKPSYITIVDSSDDKSGYVSPQTIIKSLTNLNYIPVIQGGTWTSDPSNYEISGTAYTFVDEGYEAIANGDGTYTVDVQTSSSAEIDLSTSETTAETTVYSKDSEGNLISSTLEFTLENPVFTDEEGNTVTENIVLNVEVIDVDVDPFTFIDDYVAYDIYFTVYGEKVDFEGDATVVISHDGTNAEDYKVYYVSDDGKISDVNAVYSEEKGGFVFEASHFSTYVLVNLAEVITPAVHIQYKETANPNVYEIYAVADEDKVINRLSSAQLKFAIVNDDTDRSDVAYEIEAADNVALTAPDADGYWLFNFDGTKADGGISEAVLLGKVVFDGYGKFSFGAVDTASKAQVHTATVIDNEVVDYVPGGAFELEITDSTNAFGTGDFGGIIDGEFYVPRKDLEITIDFNNSVEKNVIDYQDMTVVVSGGDLAKEIEIKLGDEAQDVALNMSNKPGARYTVDVATDNKYTVVLDDTLTVDTTYTVTVKGAGYRTVRKNVTMTEDASVNFWNNVKDAEGADYLAGDIVKDNTINIYDLSAVVSYFGRTNDTSAYSTYGKYDLNRDGKIDSKDVAYVLVSWGK